MNTLDTITTALPREITPHVNPNWKSKANELTFVLIESPLSPSDKHPFFKNIYYAQMCMQYALQCGTAPVTTHLEWTQCPGAKQIFVPDEDTENQGIGRNNALVAGDKIRSIVEEVWVFTDLGISSGMQHGIDHANKIETPVREMHLPQKLMEKVHAWKE